MDVVTGAHIAGGVIALAAGALAVAVRKGSPLHARAGTAFALSMLLLGVTATALDLMKDPPASGMGGVFTVYFVSTAWATARRRDGKAGRFEIAACGLALAIGVLIAWAALTGRAPPTPVGMGPVFVIAVLCLVAGLLDLKAILVRLTPGQRLARHLWRMCVAFFIATGSFFLGQQDVMPEAVRGSPVLLGLAFAPFAVMAFWLVRLRTRGGLRAVFQPAA